MRSLKKTNPVHPMPRTLQLVPQNELRRTTSYEASLLQCFLYTAFVAGCVLSHQAAQILCSMLCIAGHSLHLYLSLSSMHHVVAMRYLSESSPHVMPQRRLPPYASSAEPSASRTGLAGAQLPAQVGHISFIAYHSTDCNVEHKLANASLK